MDPEKTKRRKADLTGKREEKKKQAGAEGRSPVRRKKEAGKIEPAQPDPKTRKPVTEGKPEGFKGVGSIDKRK